MSVFDTLMERGFIEQCTHEKEIRELLENEKVTFYIGFDPTADSLHVGHFVTVMAMSHMQRAGHRPIVLFGGGTAMIGDPTGKTDMRKMMASRSGRRWTHRAMTFCQRLGAHTWPMARAAPATAA